MSVEAAQPLQLGGWRSDQLPIRKAHGFALIDLIFVCGILLGSLGIHKFILGYTGSGLIMLLVTLLTCGVGGVVMHVIGLIEGIIYLTKSDEEFVRTYVDGRKEWF